MAKSDSPNLISSEKAVATAGTSVTLGTGQVSALVVIAKAGNTGQIYLGGADIASTTNDGLAPDDSMEFVFKPPADLALLYIDADVSGEGVDFYGVKA